MADASGSMKSENRSGESGQPCLEPQQRVNGCDMWSLVNTDGVGEFYRVFIQLMKV